MSEQYEGKAGIFFLQKSRHLYGVLDDCVCLFIPEPAQIAAVPDAPAVTAMVVRGRDETVFRQKAQETLIAFLIFAHPVYDLKNSFGSALRLVYRTG